MPANDTEPARLMQGLIPIAAKYHKDRAQDDLEIQQQRPVFYVEEVKTDHLFEGQTIAA